MRFNHLSRYLLSAFYLVGGINHFINPDFYLPLIPTYLVYLNEINVLAGLFELVFGFGILFTITRNYAVYGIIMMLVAFIPSHVYFIQIGGCVEDGLCAPEWVGWIRLIIIHPLLIYWAWTVRNL